MTVLALVLIPVSQLLDKLVRATGDLRNRVVAANLATSQLTLVRTSSYTVLASQATSSPTTTATRTVGGVPYTVTQQLRWLNESGTGCGGSGGSSSLASTVLVQELVTWPGMGTEPAVEADTKVAPTGTYTASGSAIAVSLVDAAGASDGSGIPVAFNPGSGNGGAAQSWTTDASGCAYAANVNPGNWTVSASQTGYVDPNNNATMSVAASVTASTTLAQSDRYSPGGRFTAAWPAGVAAPPSGLKLTVTSSQLSSGSSSFVLGSGMVSPYLWPYAAPGYGVYAGDCTDSNPSYQATAGTYTYGSSVRSGEASVVVGEGATSTTPTTVGLWEDDLTITAPAGLTGVTVTYADSSCPSGESPLSVSGVPGPGTVKTGLPLGTYTVSVTGYSGGASTTTTETAALTINGSASPVATAVSFP